MWINCISIKINFGWKIFLNNTATPPIKRFDTTSAMIELFLSNKLVHVVVINNKNLRNLCKVSEEERERPLITN